MKMTAALRARIALSILAVLAACGRGESDGTPSGVVRTLVYAPSECREDARQFTFHQELHIVRGESSPVIVTDAAETFTQEPPVFAGACRLAGLSQSGLVSVFAGGVQRLGVSTDGSTVVFEKTNRFSVIGLPPLDTDREGFFVVRSDGSGLRRLGPASRASISRFAFDPSGPLGLRTTADSSLWLSPDGRTVVFTDRGPGPGDEDATQIVTLDLATGVRTQLTHLPACPPCDVSFYETGGPRFLPDGRIVFFTNTNPDGLNPEQFYRVATINPDGTGFTLVPLPIAQSGSIINQSFAITGDRPTSFDFGDPCKEMFILDHENLLQVTHFCRRDTYAGTQSADGLRAFFRASADPLGTNPSGNCQVFSIDRLGGDLRQLTSFSQGGRSSFGCIAGVGPPGCGVGPPRQDPLTETLVFESTCDPFGTNPNGGQIFAMDPDGTNLRQITDTRGFTTQADGTVHVENTGPFASTAERQ